jgi:hypothetical protein
MMVMLCNKIRFNPTSVAKRKEAWKLGKSIKRNRAHGSSED